MLRPALAISLLAACGGAPMPTTSTPAPAGGSCPSADKVVMLRWMSADDNNAPIVPGWRAYLTNKSVDGDDRAASYVAGPLAGDAPRTIWVARRDGAPCRATATRSFRQTTSEGPISEQTGVELSGCPESKELSTDFALGLVTDDAGACEITYATGVATRRGDLGTDGGWKLDGDPTPIPAALAPFVDRRPCAAPCVDLWSVGAAGADAYDVIQTWMKSTTGEGCSLEHDDATRILVRAGGRLVALPDRDVGNQELTGVFHDRSGARLVVLQDIGEYSVFTVAAAPRLAIHRVWFDRNDEDANWRSMGPYCGP